MDNSANLPTLDFNGIQVRTVMVDGEPRFVAKDACAILDLANVSMAVARLPEKHKGVSRIDTLGGPQEMAVITEAGLYTLAFRSRKPEAEEFTAKVAEFLADLRKREVARPDWSIPKTYGDALLLAAQQAKALEAAAPKVAFYDAVVADDGWFTMQKAAGEINIKGLGRNNLFRFLRDNEIFTSQSIPYRRFQEAGYFRLQPTQTPVGIRMQPMVSQRGIDFILRSWSKSQALEVVA
jgi:anti-repressor protein